MKSKQELKALVVGSGWGRNHALGLRSSGVAQVCGLCVRTDKPRSRDLASEIGVPLYTDLGRALRETAPDILTVATQERDHREATLAGLRAGAHVYCEKVMASRLSEAEEMLQVSRATNRQLGIGYNYRFSSTNEKLREWVLGGEIGEVLYGAVHAFGYCIHHTTHTMVSILGEPETVTAMVSEAEKGGDRISLLKFEEFLYSAATVKSYIVKFRSGAIVTFVSSDYQNITHPAVEVTLGGTKGRVHMEDLGGRLTLYCGERTARTWQPSLILDRVDLPYTTQRAVGAFAAAILAGERPPVSGEEGLLMMRLEKAIYESSNTSRPVSIPAPASAAE